jgi:hypothetical protein
LSTAGVMLWWVGPMVVVHARVAKLHQQEGIRIRVCLLHFTNC